MVSTAVLAAPPDPGLQRSEQIDMRRLGKVSDDERSVLRVEWRSAVTGAEEMQAVQEMLDSLRRMQGTIGEISRMIRSIPARQATVETVTAEPTESRFDDKTLALAGSAVVGLLAIWWSRRRESAAPSGAAAAASLEPQQPVAAKAVETLPTLAPQPAIAATPAGEPPAGADGQARAPVPIDAMIPEHAKTPVPEQEGSSVPPQPADIPPIEFSLEDADPEAIARANARVQKMQAKRSAKASVAGPESNVEPTLELAEIMLSLGLEEGAAETLVEYTEANPRQALHHWLKLLDIYRHGGHIEDFKETAEKLRRNFNIQAEDWAKGSQTEAPTLESFPRLSEHVQNAWMRPEECIGYLRNLLEDNREGARAGFPRPVAEEILLLIEILQETSGVAQTAGV